MRRFLFIVAATLLLSFTLSAQTTAPAALPAVQVVPEDQRASLDEVKALFDSMGATKQCEQLLQVIRTQMASSFEQEIRKQTPPPSPRLIREFRAGMDEAMNSVNLQDVMADMAAVYQKYLTRDEIVGMRAFYESPVGKSMMAKTPAIMQEYMQVALPKQMKRMEANMAAMQERMKKAIAEDQAEKNRK